jgi:hypothetical protein
MLSAYILMENKSHINLIFFFGGGGYSVETTNSVHSKYMMI